MKKTVVVVVPVYRDFVPSEAFAFARCLDVLGRYDVSLLHHAGVDLSGVLRSCPRNVTEKVIGDKWFRGVRGYNSLCLSSGFYGLYEAYEYMLIYQLDAYVFRDDLADWCARGYDYVGSPWLPNDNLFQRTLGDGIRLLRRTLCPPGSTERVTHAQLHYAVGNGGFSLRRIGKMKAVTEAFAAEIARLTFGESKAQEDVFFSVYVRRRAGIRVPPWREALRFAFENNPVRALRETGGRLPFGCHYWSRGKIWERFWHEYIPFDPKQDGDAYRD